MINEMIPMAGQSFDVVNTLAQANQAGAQARDFQRQNQLNALFQAQGDKIAAGDQNALNALARFSPDAALGVQGTRQDMTQSAGRYGMDQETHGLRMQTGRRELELLDARERRAIEEHAASLSAADAAAQRADIEADLAVLMTAQTPEQWDAYAQQTGNPELAGQFEGRNAVIAPYIGLAEVLKMQEDGEDPQSPLGKFYADQRAGLIPPDAQPPESGVRVNVNTGQPEAQTGTVPPGFARIRDDDPNNPSGFRDVPIPGGKEDTSQFDQRALQNYESKFAIVDDKLDQAISQIEQGGRWVSGIGSLLAGVPESPARDFQATVDTIKANLGFEELQAMRDSSPTGGALGQVTEREIAFLQAIQGNLDTAQSPQQLLETLKEIKTRRAEFRAERMRIMGQESAAGGNMDFSGMTSEQLLGADLSNMSEADLNAYMARMDELGL